MPAPDVPVTVVPVPVVPVPGVVEPGVVEPVVVDLEPGPVPVSPAPWLAATDVLVEPGPYISVLLVAVPTGVGWPPPNPAPPGAAVAPAVPDDGAEVDNGAEVDDEAGAPVVGTGADIADADVVADGAADLADPVGAAVAASGSPAPPDADDPEVPVAATPALPLAEVPCAPALPPLPSIDVAARVPAPPITAVPLPVPVPRSAWMTGGTTGWVDLDTDGGRSPEPPCTSLATAHPAAPSTTAASPATTARRTRRPRQPVRWLAMARPGALRPGRIDPPSPLAGPSPGARTTALDRTALSAFTVSVAGRSCSAWVTVPPGVTRARCITRNHAPSLLVKQRRQNARNLGLRITERVIRCSWTAVFRSRSFMDERELRGRFSHHRAP